MPFADNTFDCVCSFDVIGHVPLESKNRLVKEIYRVLKPGGLTFHYIEVDSSKGYNNWAKSYPALYRQFFIDLEGHVGLECFKDALRRFTDHGFMVINFKGLSKIAIPPGEFSKRFNNDYREKNPSICALAIVDSVISSNVLTKALAGILLKPFSLLIEPIVPNEYSGLLYAAFIKR